MEPIIRTESVSRTFKSGSQSVHALKDISIEVMPGAITILKGPSGSGKTTLINLLGALDTPTSGKVFLNGKEISRMPEAKKVEIRRKDMGFIFQSVALVSLMSAYENVDFALRLSGFKKGRDKRAEECLNLVGLKKRMHHRPAELSGGEQQRVTIARAISHEPRVIFADEPTAMLDTHMGLQVMKLFRRLTESQKATIVMTTHDPNMIELAERVYTIEDGMIAGVIDNIIAREDAP